ncbi:MAG: hypothetical protein ABID84_02760 [Chloroflexota bacterium]
MRNKTEVVGAGNVGANVALRLFRRGYANVVLVNVMANRATSVDGS